MNPWDRAINRRIEAKLLWTAVSNPSYFSTIDLLSAETTLNKTLALMIFCAAAIASTASPGQEASSYDWSGFYAGFHFGAARGSLKATDYTQPSGGFFTDLVPAGTEGFAFLDTNVAGGVHIGAQYQANQLVLGAEGTYDATAIKQAIVSPYFPDSDILTGSLTHYVTAVGRIGVTVDRLMIYGKAGYAGGEMNFKARDNDSLVTYDETTWHNGYAIGAGIEYAIADNVTLGLDYTHVDLGVAEHTGPNVFDDGSLGKNPETYRTSVTADAITARLSFKFGAK